MDVVLPAPLTPVTITTVGWAGPMGRVFSKGSSSSVSTVVSRARSSVGVCAWADLARWRSCAIKYAVAETPVSAMSRAFSRSSNKASSMRLPPKTEAMPEAVLPRPAFRRLSQPWRAAAGGAAGSGVTAPGAGVAGVDFLKKLNMQSFIEWFIL